MQPAIHLPPIRTLARRSLPHVLEGALVPVTLFYGALHLIGPLAALAAALAWSYTAVLRRLLLRRRVPGLLLLGTLALTARTAISLATGSLFIYFLQPTIGTVAMAVAFLLSLPTGRPLAQRLAADFMPLPPALLAHPVTRRLFSRITLLWAFVLLANAAMTLALLLTEEIATFVLTRTVASFLLTGGAIVGSALWFRRSLRRHGLLGSAG